MINKEEYVLEGSILHVAGCTSTAIVGGFSNVDPKFRMPIRHNKLGWQYYPVIPPEDLACRFCQTKMNYLYKHDFKECFYKDFKCLDLLSPNLYVKQLAKIL